MRGEATAHHIAKELQITKEGARKHLLNLEERMLIASEAKSSGVGRPSTYYSLTEKGLAEFPDAHAEVTIQLLESVKRLLGDNALDLLINDRETVVYKRYEDALKNAVTIEDKLALLSKKRSEEGYMANWKKEDETYYLIENHCPICAAAKACQGFCRSEFKNFKQLIGDNYTMKRVEYIIENGNRCVYKIDPVS